jgi:FHS family L-fucose permease-like MFS transporter
VIVLAIVFSFAPMPEIKMEDDYHLDDSAAERGPVRHFWSHPHFYLAVLSQFLYVAAQAGVWSFFVNYMTSQTPSVPPSWVKGLESLQASLPTGFGGWLGGWFKTQPGGAIIFSDKGASTLASVAFLFFVAGRFTGSGILKKSAAHRVLGFYGATCMLLCLLVFLKLGWLSVACVFFSYFFMSIIFPTIFALGIFGLGEQAKKASSFIVMAIVGGAVLPKVMGMVADRTDLSRGFIVPLLCFAMVALYGFLWPRLSGHEGMHGVNTTRGH